MSVVLNTNIASLMASNNLLSAQSALATSVQRLSSGLRINSAKDDAAGLGVANSLTAQINGADQGIRNLNDGISMTQTAEGAIAAASDMGQQMLTLATQGANGTLGADQRAAIKAQMLQLISSINSISGRTAFSGNPLLSYATDSATNSNLYSMQISNSASDKIQLSSDAFKNIGSGQSDTLVLTNSVGGKNAVTLSTGPAVGALTGATSSVTSGTQTVTFNSLKAGQSITVNGLTLTATQDLSAAQVAGAFVTTPAGTPAGVSGGSLTGSNTGTTATAASSATGAGLNQVVYTTAANVTGISAKDSNVPIATDSTISSTQTDTVQFVNSNSGQVISLNYNYDGTHTATLTLTLSQDATGSDIAKAFNNYLSNNTYSPTIGTFSGTDGGATPVNTAAAAQGKFVAAWNNSVQSGQGQATSLLAAINAIEPTTTVASAATLQFQAVQTAANNYVTALTTQRSLLGAYDNQMNYTLSNITTLSSNLQAARSRVQDVDYASETAKLTKGQILQQAATAMLAQANQMPNVILTLLK